MFCFLLRMTTSMSYVKFAHFFWHGVLWRPRFFSALSAAGSARGPWVYCDACLDPGRAPRRGSERSASLSWVFVKGLCSASPRRSGAWKTLHWFCSFMARFVPYMLPSYCCLVRRSYTWSHQRSSSSNSGSSTAVEHCTYLWHPGL